eukprot:1161741-Pelagomonas_calceolata.AAC.14
MPQPLPCQPLPTRIYPHARQIYWWCKHPALRANFHSRRCLFPLCSSSPGGQLPQDCLLLDHLPIQGVLKLRFPPRTHALVVPQVPVSPAVRLHARAGGLRTQACALQCTCARQHAWLPNGQVACRAIGLRPQVYALQRTCALQNARVPGAAWGSSKLCHVEPQDL